MEAKLEIQPQNEQPKKKSKPLTPLQKEKSKIAADRAKSYLNLDPNDRAVSFYNTFDGLSDKPITIEKELVEYATAIFRHHNKPLPVINICNAPKVNHTPQLNQENALITFSGGTDCVASAIWALKKGYKVYLLHLYNLNKSVAGFECAAVFDTAKTLGLESNLIVINHFIKGKKSTTNEFLENPAKNQYLYLIALKYMSKFDCGTLIVSGQDDGESEYFSDTKNSYTLFYQYAESLIGQHQCIFPFAKKQSYVYTLLLESRLAGKEALLYQVNSCFRRRLAGFDNGCSLIRFWAIPTQLSEIPISTKAAYIRAADMLFYVDNVTTKKLYPISLSEKDLELLDSQLNTAKIEFGEQRLLSPHERAIITKVTRHYSNTNECCSCAKCKRISKMREELSSLTEAPEDMPLIITTKTNLVTRPPMTAKSPTLFNENNAKKRKREDEDSDSEKKDIKRMNLKD